MNVVLFDCAELYVVKKKYIKIKRIRGVRATKTDGELTLQSWVLRSQSFYIEMDQT